MQTPPVTAAVVAPEVAVTGAAVGTDVTGAAVGADVAVAVEATAAITAAMTNFILIV